MRSGKADSNVASWVETVDAGLLYLSVISIMELNIGIFKMERKNPEQGDLLRNWLEKQVLSEFDGRVIPVDVSIAWCCAQLHVHEPHFGT